jgi:uncharacterized membrane protein YphA (DoxX/SURF4 family)
MWGETITGLALLLGAFTGFAAVIGILMNFSILTEWCHSAESNAYHLGVVSINWRC